MSNKVIVFGPTGNVGRFAATTAQAHGAQVFLAMRDTGKSVPGLSPDDEKRDGFQRVQADLTAPETVQQAVKETGAKAAFIYLAFGSSDHMKATIEALKAGGVEFVVFLSSYTTRGELEKIPESELISFAHAQVELNLAKVFGQDNFVAIRPGGFATNSAHWWSSQIASGTVKVFRPDASFDGITANDMGAVAGTILAKGKQGDQKIVYLFGPEVLSQHDQLKVIGEALGKKIDVVSIESEENVELFQAAGMPPPVAQYLTKTLGEMAGGGIADEDRNLYAEGVANIQKYIERSPMGFRQWVEQNTDLFKA